MNNLKVLLAHNYYLQGGGEDIAFENEVELLRQHGHEVLTYTRDNREFKGAGTLDIASGAIWSQSAYRDLRLLVREEQPEVVHFHNTFPLISPAAYYAARSGGAAVVQTIHNYRLSCPVATHFRDGEVCLDCMGKIVPWPSVVHACYHDSRAENVVITTMLAAHRLINTWNGAVDAYIALGEFMRGMLVEAGVGSELIHIKPNFLQDPKPDAQDRQGAVYVGRLSQEKGLHTLLAAWAQLDEIPLKIIGTGPLEEELANIIDENELSHVQLVGFQPHPETLAEIMQAQFMVVPSLSYEGLPTTVLEAFACGTPVVVSDHGALAEMVQDGVQGVKFTPGNSGALVAAIEQRMMDRRMREAMGEAARQTYLRKYAPEPNYRRLIEIYQKALVNQVDESSG